MSQLFSHTKLTEELSQIISDEGLVVSVESLLKSAANFSSKSLETRIAILNDIAAWKAELEYLKSRIDSVIKRRLAINLNSAYEDIKMSSTKWSDSIINSKAEIAKDKEFGKIEETYRIAQKYHSVFNDLGYILGNVNKVMMQ